MLVDKYRSVAEMPRNPAVSEDKLAATIRKLWNRTFLLSPPMFARGVARFRTIEEANEARTQATLFRMRAQRRPR